MTIKEIVLEFDKRLNMGLQISKRKGILNSTWVIYQRKGLYYFFDICETFIFDSHHSYTLDELIEEFTGDYFEIDLDVS